jgi:hypothetical protein
MSNEDLLILEARLTSKDIGDSDLTSRAALDFYLGPLADLGISIDSAQIGIEADKGVSGIRETTTQIVRYGSLTLDSTTFRDICLARIHSYTRDALLTTLQSIGLEVLFSQVNSQSVAPSLVCVVRRATGIPGPKVTR